MTAFTSIAFVTFVAELGISNSIVMSLLILPDEILDQMLSHKNLTGRDLCRISLVSKRLSSLAVSRIYYAINLSNWNPNRIANLNLFLRTLDESPQRGELVRILNLAWGARTNRRGPHYVFNIIRRMPVLHTLRITDETGSMSTFANLTFPDDCPMAHLRRLIVWTPGITAADIAKYTVFPKIEYLEVIWFSGKAIMDPESFTKSIDDPTMISPLKHLKFVVSRVAWPHALENILSRLKRLERLDWELGAEMEPETDMISISDRLQSISQTLAELHLSIVPGHNVYFAGPLVDFANFEVLNTLSIDDRILFSNHPPFPVKHRHDEEMNFYCRLPPLLRTLEICLGSETRALGSSKLEEHDYGWIINLVKRSPALRKLIIKETCLAVYPQTSEYQDCMWPYVPPIVEWDQPHIVRQFFEANDIIVQVLIRGPPSL